MYLSGINYESINEGEGVRAVFYVSGCRHNCKGCHNPDTHSFTNGTEVTDELIEIINEELDKRKFLSGITLSGGDPMFSPVEVLAFVKKLHIPKNNIWIYSGFKFEEMLCNKDKINLLEECDILVDGKYIESKRDVSLLYMGSTNQRIIKLKKFSELPWHIQKKMV